MDTVAVPPLASPPRLQSPVPTGRRAARGLLIVPLVLVVGGVWWGRARQQSAPPLPADTPITPAQARLSRARLEQSLRREAYAAAQRFVAARLPVAAGGGGAQFAPWSETNQQTGSLIEIGRLSPDRYRVRATASWPRQSGEAATCRFEADLRHGPADDRWRLVDSEILETDKTQ